MIYFYFSKDYITSHFITILWIIYFCIHKLRQNTKLTKLRTRRNRLYFADDSAKGGAKSPDLRVLLDSALDGVAQECKNCKKSGKTESGPLRLPERPDIKLH